jgi:hypothetical protein
MVRTGDGVLGPGMMIEAEAGSLPASWTYTISPRAICTDNDRPRLDGPASAPVPGGAQTHVISGGALSGGVNAKWDASRRIRIKVLNPHLYPPARLDVVPGHLWNAQPAAVTIPENYPGNDVIGNDDAGTGDECNGACNNPYQEPWVGLLTGYDKPSSLMQHATGDNGDTMEVRYHFGEFARLQIGNEWCRISDFTTWKVHFRHKKVGNVWIDNGTFGAANNDGF